MQVARSCTIAPCPNRQCETRPCANRYFSAQPDIQRAAAQLYESAKDLPLVCPHGHVDPRLFADPDYQFGSPVDLLIIPDHYIFRMLYSQGIALESLGIPHEPLVYPPFEQRGRNSRRQRPPRYLAIGLRQLASLPRHADRHMDSR